MAHAVKGDYIRIRDTNCAEWVKLGETYKVESVVETDDEYDACFYLEGVQISWYADEGHYTIVTKDQSLLEEAARRYPKGTHYLDVGGGTFGNLQTSFGSTPKVFDYQRGNPRIAVDDGRGLVYMNGVWAPIVHSSYQTFQKDDTVVRWRDIEDWEWRAIGEVQCPPIGTTLQISKVHGSNGLYKVPSIELGVLGWYPATAFIFSEYYKPTITNRGTAELNTSDHGKSKISTGISIEVQRPLASIISGKGRTGSRVQGRRDAAVVRRGHLSYKTITGK